MRSKRPPASLLLAGAVPAALVMLPLGYTVFQSLEVGPSIAVGLLIRPLVGKLLLNTIGLVLACTLLCGAIGTGVAWCVERIRLPGQRVWSVLVACPLAIPPFISSFAWVSLSNDLQDFAGALLVVSSAYFPLVYLPVAASLRGLDPALEEAGRSLGLNGWQSFTRVVVPQLRPALLGGMLLVALNTLVEFGAFSLLRFRTFTTQLYAQYRTGLDGPESSLLAVVLVALCLLCLGAEAWLRGKGGYARIGAGTPRRSRKTHLGWMVVPVLMILALLVGATVGVPIGMIGFWLFQHAQAANSPVVASLPSLVSSTAASLGYGAAGAAVTVVLAMPLGYLATRYPGRWVHLAERCAFLAQGVPGIVVALALIALTVQSLRPLYQSAVLLVITYAILFVPLALVSVRASMAQARPALEEAGRSLGLGWFAVSRRVLLPVIGPGLGAAAAMVFIAVVTELTSTLLLSPIGTRTLATQVWVNTSALAFAAAAPFAGVMLLLSLVSTWLLTRRFGVAILAVGT